MKRVRVKILGDVVGVGLRSFVVREATKLGINGWVRNVNREYVETVFEGKEGAVDLMIKKCKDGVGTYIERVDVKEEDFQGDFKSFEIVSASAKI